MKKNLLVLVSAIYFMSFQSACRSSRSGATLSEANPARLENLASLPADTWQIISQKLEQPFIEVQFLNETNGWAISANFLWRTQDGGHNWAKVATSFTASVLGSSQKSRFYRMQFLNEREGWVLEEGHLLQTNDAGVTWRKQIVPNTVIRSFRFLDAAYGWAVGGTAIRSNNEATGESWQGGIFNTRDGGNTWKNIPTKIRLDYDWSLFDVWPIDEKQIWVVGDVCLYSWNGGKVWNRFAGTESIYGVPSKIQFAGSDTGWITTSQGDRFLLTTNGGKSWEVKQGPPNVGGGYRLVLVKPDKFWWVVNNIFHSSDGGETWTKEAEGHFNDLYYVPGLEMIFAVGDVISSRRVR